MEAAFEERFYTSTQAAELLQVKPDLIRHWIRKGHPVAGKLRAGNTSKTSRPRFRIWGPDLSAFFMRTFTPPSQQPRKRRSRPAVKEYV